MNTEATPMSPGFDVDRREFLRHSSTATLMASLAGGALTRLSSSAADPAPLAKKQTAPVSIGVIGCGSWGRDTIKTLAQLINAEVMGVSDHYEVFLRRGKESAPKAEAYKDYRQMLENKRIKAVVVATPTHQHKQVVLDALAAGKHVYCEAPLAHTVEDARDIIRASRQNFAQVFQPGLQHRSDPQRHFLLQFLRSGAAGRIFKTRSQWHKKDSWRRTSPNPEREKELNWRMEKAISIGLPGEVSVQHIDNASWFLKEEPVAIQGYGSIQLWNDGREIPDNVHLMIEYPERVLMSHEACLATSYDSDHETYYGGESAVLVRKNKAWMFRESDAPLLGWEVYARKDKDAFFDELGIALVANATKLAAQGDKPVEEAPYANTPLYYALEAFLHNVHTYSDGVTDFTENFDATDKKAMKEYLDSLHKALMPAATGMDGYRATVVGITAHQASLQNSRIVIPKELLQVS